jgi:hypothetical protein
LTSKKKDVRKFVKKKKNLLIKPIFKLNILKKNRKNLCNILLKIGQKKTKKKILKKLNFVRLSKKGNFRNFSSRFHGTKAKQKSNEETIIL